MDKTGYYVKLLSLVTTDWHNREKVLETEAGRNFEKGLGATLKTFKELAKTGDLELITRAEELTVIRERDLFGKDDPSVLPSLNSAVNDFAVIRTALPTVQVPEDYQKAATTYHSKKKAHGVPADGFHEAANSHITRLGNRMSAVGVSVPEKNILRQRQANMRVAKELYVELQRKALGVENTKKQRLVR